MPLEVIPWHEYREKKSINYHLIEILAKYIKMYSTYLYLYTYVEFNRK